MHVVYKLIALSVVFGLVLSTPAQITARSYDDFSNEFVDVADDAADDKDINDSRTVDLVLPGLELLPVLLGLIPKIAGVAGLKTKALAILAGLIKWLAPKTIFLAIGAIGTFAFCKISNLCSLTYDPVVYDLVPPQVRSFVTPERLEDAQQLLMSALQEYNNQGFDS